MLKVRRGAGWRATPIARPSDPTSQATEAETSSLICKRLSAPQPTEEMMPTTVKQMLSEANASVPKLSPSDAQQKMNTEGVLVLDVRDPSEIEKTGKIKGAVNVSRGMLEFRADPESQYHIPAFDKGKTVLTYCASGGRSALAGKTLKEMGYGTVYNIGGFKELADAGLETEPASPS